MTYLEILRRYWGYDSFRGIQEAIIDSIGNGRDTLGLMPTGGGKSITFQVPALAMDGVCLVITPLIALMKDQVRNLKEHGIRAAAIYSGISRDEIVLIMEDCIFGGCKFLYVSPERLSSDLFQTKLRHMKVSMITVDEAHCISQWGYDFRPAYLKIADVRDILPGVPVLALTATATPKVAADIQEKLGFKEQNAFRMSFARDNLRYVVRETDNKPQELIHILSKISGAGIVYVRNRKETKEIADALNGAGISALYYHAGLEQRTKDERQHRWTNGGARIMVATNAFGMGIDKPDVRIVAHINTPDSPEAYYQEAGRAGRDGLASYAVLLFSPGDKRILSKRISDTFPEKDFIRKVYDKLSYMHNMAVGDGKGCTFNFSLADFCSRYSLPPVQTDSALRILSRMEYIEYVDEADYQARLMFTTTKEELYHLRHDDAVTNSILNVILRTYSGIFAEQSPIDEQFICDRVGNIDRDMLYDILTGLDKAGIIRYIPQRRTPLIIWKRARVESSMLNFTPEAYELRKAEYRKRIQAMTEYATRRNGCRSSMLLEYFGEKADGPCNHCDLCIREKQEKVSLQLFNEIKSRIIDIIDNGNIAQDSIFALPFGKEQIEYVLSRLIADEELTVCDGRILTKRNHNE